MMNKNITKNYYKKSGKQSKILEAAAGLIGEKGVDKTSLADIARASGISKGTLYYYYPTKNDLIFDITRIHMDQITGKILEKADRNGKYDNFSKLLYVLFDSLLNNETRSRLHLYLVREAISGNKKLKARFNETYREWFFMIEQVNSRIGGLSSDIKIKSSILVAVIDGFIIQNLIGSSQIDVDAAVGQIQKIFENENK